MFRPIWHRILAEVDDNVRFWPAQRQWEASGTVAFFVDLCLVSVWGSGKWCLKGLQLSVSSAKHAAVLVGLKKGSVFVKTKVCFVFFASAKVTPTYSPDIFRTSPQVFLWTVRSEFSAAAI